MFDRLQERFEKTLRGLRGLGKIRESNIQDALNDVRSALLEADVSYRVVQSFIDSVRAKAMGESVLDSVDPGQQFVKILHDELIRVLGREGGEIVKPKGRPLVILLAGLQGSGKTTTAAKLGRYLRDTHRLRPLLVAADTARPAAREQLEQLGRQNGMQVYAVRSGNPSDVVRGALRSMDLRETAADCAILDTAGRLHVDERLMEELAAVRDESKPDLVLYVLDAMAGQDAVRAAEEFSRRIGFDGVIVTKLDGDARGGAALSVALACGKPVFFIGTGENVDAIEPLRPQRLASRILGMGDIVSLVEKAQSAVDEKEAQRMAERLRGKDFSLDDFAEQMQMVKKMGSMEQILDLLPGGGQLKKALPGGGLPEKELTRVDAIIKSMTPRERRNPQVLDGRRRLRIAGGSGTSVAEVNRLLKQFLAARKMMGRMSRVGMKGFRRGGMNPFL